VRSLRALLLRLTAMFRKEQDEADFSEELRAHLQMHIEDNRHAGMSPEESRREALLKLGGLEPTREIYRERRSLPLLETLLLDFRYSARTLRRNPGFTLIAVLTLALGIGANTAIFSMVNALLLHPYDFPQLERLVRVWENRGIDEGVDSRFIAQRDAADFAGRTEVFESLTTFRCGDFNLSAEGEVRSARGCRVAANFFNVLGTAPAFGRGFRPEEDQRGADAVAIVSYGFWQRNFAGDASLLGKTLQLNGRKYTVIGIMPRNFSYPVPFELWVPMGLTAEEQEDRTKLGFEAMARLKNGVSAAQAQSALEPLSRRLQQEYPATNANRRSEVLPLRKELYLYTLPLFGLLQVAAIVVLLLACANLANLLFARIFGRQKEIAVRTALGAGRWRLARLFITETILLSTLAGTVAVAASFWSVNLLRTSIAPSWTMWVPGWDGIHVDRTALEFTLLLVITVSVLFGVATALHAKQAEPYSTLKESGRGSNLGRKGRLRSALVVAQVVFAFVVLVCAGLVTQAFLRLVTVYQGFQADGVLRMEIRLPQNTYSDNKRVAEFYDRLLKGSAALPGAGAAAVVANSPASNVDNETTFFSIRGRSTVKAADAPSADLQISSPDYFSALRIPLLSGRLFLNSDEIDTACVAVVSRSMALRYWPSGDALGQQIKLGASDSAEPWMTIIGIVEDVRQNWWNPTNRPTIYEPFFQTPQRSMVFVLRVASNPVSYVSSVRDIVRGLDDQLALNGVGTLEREITDSIAIIRIMGVLMALFGCVALALASVGVYGVLAESVARRIPEIGIRLALGADPRDILRLVLGKAFRLTLAGLAIGLPIAFLANRAMVSLIFGIVTVNFPLLAAFTVLLLLIAAVAAYVPARRGMRVDPIVALRYE
jgi:putative ABC transport system permease protein